MVGGSELLASLSNFQYICSLMSIVVNPALYEVQIPLWQGKPSEKWKDFLPLLSLVSTLASTHQTHISTTRLESHRYATPHT